MRFASLVACAAAAVLMIVTLAATHAVLASPIPQPTFVEAHFAALTERLRRQVQRRDDAATAALPVCKKYTIIQTRGTSEKQGPSGGFLLMNAFTMLLAAGGTQYFTVYPADVDQLSAEATDDIVAKVSAIVALEPQTCIVLEGYSQGAAATTVALSKLSDAEAEAVKAVFMIGNPFRTPGLPCNVDVHGSTSTLDALGLQTKVLGLLGLASSVPPAFVNRTLDVCAAGDGICDSNNGLGYGAQGQHLTYGQNIDTQSMGYIFLTSILHHNSFLRAGSSFDTNVTITI